MKRILIAGMALVYGLTVSAKTIYLNTGGSSLWNQANAVFFVHSWDSGDADTKMTHLTGDIYSVDIPNGNNHIIFLRQQGSSSSVDWDNCWNKTNDLSIPSGKNCFTITAWGQNTKVCSGTWSSYTPPTPNPDAPKFYVTGDSALVVDAGAGIAKKWNADAIPSQGDTLVLNLMAGVDYKLKATTDGTWSTARGYDDLTSKASGLSKDKDGNICFRLSEAGGVNVIYTATIFKLEGSFYVAPDPVGPQTVRLVPSEEWLVADAKFAAWVWGDAVESQWTEWFSGTGDTLTAVIPAGVDSIDFVRFSPKASTPNWTHKGEQVWGEIKTPMDYNSLTWTVIGWDAGQWTPVERPCESYGLLVDGEFVAGKKNVLQTEWTEYMVRKLALTAGQEVQIYNACAEAAWVISNYASTSFTFPIINNKYVVEESGVYDFYIKFIYQADEIYISKQGTYTTAVRSECRDVMMQAFYNESYNDAAPGVSQYGNTRWATLLPQVDEIGDYFDLVWLPPSANGDGMGYHPKEYSNQNSNWGTRAELESLISAFHDKNTKVVADIVINHCTGWSSWCDFPTMDFGEYGVFHPDASYICRNDEVNAEWNKTSAGSCWGAATGSYDDGENWDGARDWSHNDVYVQDMFKAYLKWMRNVMHYDGFRYDKGDGFNNWHHDNYNKAAGPYIAFMESYNGDDKIIAGIEGANRNLMALDFQTKWQAFDGIAGFDYSKCQGSGLLGRGYAKYAVTFIESHDWFLRSDNQNEFGGRGNSMTSALKDRLMQANAFLLSMPGLPCVFYPHWVKYKADLKPMIEARKAAGVHTESGVADEYADHDGYQATIRGKNGWLILQLGNKTTHTAWDTHYTLMASGPGYAMWVNVTEPSITTGIDETVEAEQPAVLNPSLPMYNVMGQRVGTGFRGVVIQDGHKFILQ